jgi:integrase
MQVMNKNTAKEYYFRLVNFEKFVISQYNINNFTLDTLINDINNGKIDPYELLSNYCIYLQEVNGIKTSTTLKQRVVTVKNFLEFNDIDISPRKFKLKVKLPKTIRRLENKEALDRNDIVNILNSCSEIRLKTYIMLLASTGMRAVEALSIRNNDLDLDSYPAKVTIKGEYTKTKADRYVFLTKEIVGQLTKWLEFKYRTRRVCYTDKNTGKSLKEYRTPQKNVNDFVFSVRNNNNESIDGPKHFYANLVTQFEKTLDRNGIGGVFNKNISRRREVTLHSFRRYTKSTISDLGFQDYSEWFIGHSGSTYWRKKDNEKAEIFKKIEHYLTFLDIQQLERQGADLQTKIQELQDVNQVLRTKQSEREDQINGMQEQIQTLIHENNRSKQEFITIAKQIQDLHYTRKKLDPDTLHKFKTGTAEEREEFSLGLILQDKEQKEKQKQELAQFIIQQQQEEGAKEEAEEAWLKQQQEENNSKAGQRREELETKL